MTLRYAIAAGFVLAIVANTGQARAGDAIPVRLRYSAPPSCPSADDFLAQVAVRAPRARRAAADEVGTALRVVVREVPGGSAGTLELIAPDARPSLREVSAADCSQVVSALALMTALAIEPNPSAAEGTVLGTSETRPQIRSSEHRPLRPRSGAGRGRWVVGAGAQLEALGGFAPDPVWLVRPFVQLARETGSAWSYALRLSVLRAHAEIENDQGRGDLTLWAGRLEACPLRGAPVRRLVLSACVPVQAGRLAAVGSGFADNQWVGRPWLSVGTAGRIEWRAFELLVLEAAGGLFFPVVRDRFFVGADATLHRAPAVAGEVSVGLGVRFP